MDHIRVCFTEHTLEGFIFNALGISSMLDKLTERVSEDLKELELVAKTVTLSYQTQNFEKRDKSQTLDNYTCEKQDLLDVVVKMLTKEVNYGTRLRLLGVRCTNLLNME
jgi:nucleotidyltransferase/DNA polymerase involved in DNA repair